MIEQTFTYNSEQFVVDKFIKYISEFNFQYTFILYTCAINLFISFLMMVHYTLLNDENIRLILLLFIIALTLIILCRFQHNIDQAFLIDIKIDIFIFLFFHTLELYIVVYSLTNFILYLLLFESLIRYISASQKKGKILKKVLIYFNFLLIYYYVYIISQNDSFIRKQFTNSYHTIVGYFVLKFIMLFAIPTNVDKNRQISEFLAITNSAIITLNDEIKVIFYNDKFNSLLSEIFKELNFIGCPLSLMEKLITSVEENGLEKNLGPEIKEFVMKELKNTILNDELMEDGSESMILFCNFIKRFKEDFIDYRKIMRTTISESSFRYTLFDIYLKIEEGKYHFLINETTNYSTIEEENYRKGRCLAKIAHDIKIPLKSIDKFCQDLKVNKYLITQSSDSSDSPLSTDFIEKMKEYILSLIDNLNIVMNGNLVIK